MWKPESKKAQIIGTGVKFRQNAGKDYPVIGEFEPNEWVKLLNSALVDKVTWHRVKRNNGQFVWVIDYYLHVPLRQ
ncbi:MAG: hypothetical protein IJ056_09415 [Acidaminococcaceae bacterium]|nr:hypothetical protein [Acidaminococcaceae bacterium]MBR1590904.1 hypothetical protein [Acidaminococcaceae bacterium]